ncbi:MAG: PAS domain S-box protein [Deltaproteobacteria bacterium]|nr:PAS domain S-box protein [Deltaproteobacteria bacterium]
MDYKTLAQNLPGIVYRVYLQEGNRPQFFNAMLEPLTGYKAEELAPVASGLSPLLQIIPEEERDHVTRAIRLAVSAERPFEVSYRVRHKNGSSRYLRERGRPVSDGEKCPAFIDGFILDVTDYATAEQRLVEEKNLSDGIIESLPGIFYLIAGGERIVRWNKNLETVSGYPAEEIERMRPLKFFNEREKPLVASKIEEVLIKGSAVVEAALVSRDGNETPFMFTGVRVELEGVPHIVGIGLDITERKRVEEEELKARKIESLGVLAGGIAHEFNNYLTAILGNVSFVREFLKVDEKASSRLASAEKALSLARSLTYQLLTFASGGAPVKKTIDVGDKLREAAGFALRASKADCALLISDRLRAVDADEEQIRQAFVNMIRNADEALGGKGSIEIRAENVTVEAGSAPLPKGDYIKVSVKDSGAGIPEEDLKRIFDPYFTTKEKRSGLGLSVAYSVIKAHNGHIEVDSSPGRGTVFSVYIPALPIEAARPAAESISMGKGRILLMDDDESIRDISGSILKELGYDVALASDGGEAIERYKEAWASGSPFDAVIMDLTVQGGMGGKEAIKRLLDIAPGARVIVSSGYSNDPIMSEYKKYGFKEVLVKPYRMTELSETVRRALKDD